MNLFSNKSNIRGSKSEMYGKINNRNYINRNISNVRNDNNMSPPNNDVEGYMNLGKVDMEEQTSVISNNESPYNCRNKNHTYNKNGSINSGNQANIYSNVSSRVNSSTNNRETKQFVSSKSTRAYSQSLNVVQLQSNKPMNMFQTSNNVNNDLSNVNSDDKYSCSGYISSNKKRTENLSVAGSNDSFRTQANSQIVEQSIELLKHFISQDKNDYNAHYNEKNNMLLKLIDKVKTYDDNADIFNKEWKHSINNYKKKIDFLNLKFMKLKNENASLNNENILLKNQIKNIKINYQNDMRNASSAINIKQTQDEESLEAEQLKKTNKNETAPITHKTLYRNMNPSTSSSLHVFPKTSESKRVVINSIEQMEKTCINNSVPNSYEGMKISVNYKTNNLNTEYISALKERIREELEEKYKQELQILRNNAISNDNTNALADFHWDAIQYKLEDLLDNVIKQYNDKIVQMFNEAMKECQKNRDDVKQYQRKKKVQENAEKGSGYAKGENEIKGEEMKELKELEEEVEKEEEEEEEGREKETRIDETPLLFTEIDKQTLECERIFDYVVKKKVEKKERSSKRENTCVHFLQTLDTIHTKIEKLNEDISNMNLNIDQNDMLNCEEDSLNTVQNMDRSFSKSVFDFDEYELEEDENEEVKSKLSMETLLDMQEEDINSFNNSTNCINIINQFYSNMKEEFQKAAENEIPKTDDICSSNTAPSHIKNYTNDISGHIIRVMKELNTKNEHNEIYNENEHNEIYNDNEHNEIYNENENVNNYETLVETRKDLFSSPLAQKNYSNLIHNEHIKEDPPLSNELNKEYNNLEEHMYNSHDNPFHSEILRENNKWENDNFKQNELKEVENIQSENVALNKKKNYNNNKINKRSQQKKLKDNFSSETEIWKKNENDKETEYLKRNAINFFDMIGASQNDMSEYVKEQNTKDDEKYYVRSPISNSSYTYNETSQNSQQYLNQEGFAYSFATPDNQKNGVGKNGVNTSDGNSYALFNTTVGQYDHTNVENRNNFSPPNVYPSENYIQKYDLTRVAASQKTEQEKPENESEKETPKKNKKSQNEIVNNVSYSYHPLIKKKSLVYNTEGDYKKKVQNENTSTITATNNAVARNPNVTIKERHTLKKKKEMSAHEEQEKKNSLEKIPKQWQSKEQFEIHTDFQKSTHTYVKQPFQMENEIIENPVFGRTSYDPFKSNTNEIEYDMHTVKRNSNHLRSTMENGIKGGNEKSNTVDISSYENIYASPGYHSNYTHMMNLDSHMRKQMYQKKESYRKSSDASIEPENRGELMENENGQERNRFPYIEDKYNDNYNYYYPYDEKKKKDEPVMGPFQTSGSILQMNNPASGIISHSYHNKNINLRRINSNALIGNNKSNTTDIYHNGRIKLGTKSEIHSSLSKTKKEKAKKKLRRSILILL